VDFVFLFTFKQLIHLILFPLSNKLINALAKIKMINLFLLLSCVKLRPDTFIEMAGVMSNIWLCEVCMPNLMKYVPVSSSHANDVATFDAVEERLIPICDLFDAATVSAADANDRHRFNLHELLESRLSLAALGVEKVSSSLLDGGRLYAGGETEKTFGEVDQKDVQHHHGRFANRNRLIITNMPVRPESRLIDCLGLLVSIYSMVILQPVDDQSSVYCCSCFCEICFSLAAVWGVLLVLFALRK
jgi:hypothetical protein